MIGSEDKDLLASYKHDNDMAAFGKLYKRHSHVVLGLCLHFLKDYALAEDTVMEIFELLVDKLKTQQVLSFRPWLLQLTRNHCLRKIQRELSKSRTEELKESHYQIMENTDDLTLSKEILFDDLEKAVASLSAPQQKCLSLFYYKKYTYQDIVNETDFSLKEVKSHLQNAKEKLRRQLKSNLIKE